MGLYEKLLAGEEKLSLVGLGYVGMPIAVAYAKKIKVVGYDFNAAKVELYKKGIDPTREVGDEAIKNTSVEFTADPEKLRECKFHVVAVPTPVNDDHTPDLSPVEGASHTLGKYLTKGSIVVYESTVYPGVTEDICVPILEQESGLKCGVDFKVGYSPERINPGDKVHRLDTITKIVSGMDEETLEKLREIIVNPQESKGIGISNIVQRLRLFYGDDYSMNVESVEDEGTVISISVPDHIREI